MITSAIIKSMLNGANDICYLDLFLNQNKKRVVTLVYIDGMVNPELVDESILKPLTLERNIDRFSDEELVEQANGGLFYHFSHKVKDSPDEVIGDILTGNAALIIDGAGKAVVFDIKGFVSRGVGEPSSENVVKGPKDCFVETIRFNTALIRRRICTRDLRITGISIGSKSVTNVAVVYLNGTADPDLVKEVTDRLKSIDIDAVKSAGEIEEQLADNRYALFPQCIYTERPDKLCANILEGKIGIIIDGYPIAYIVPAVFPMFFQSGEDYSQGYVQSSLIRILRFTCAIMSLILPAFYISIVNFHQEMIPTSLLLAIVKSKEQVPFTSFLEMLFMLVAFEILIEAGIRLPKSIGSAISIMGGLVVGDAAVNAKFVSPVVVVVIAVTGICGFVIPNNDLANTFRTLRFMLAIFGAAGGLYGFSLALILLLYYLCTLSSFDAPYMRPYKSPAGSKAIRDGLFRLPIKGSFGRRAQ